MSDEKLNGVPALCESQREKTLLVEAELKQLGKRLSRQRVAPVLTFVAYGFNCDEHDVKGSFHLDYIAGGGRTDIPGSLQVAIVGIEHLLSELKSKVQ